MIRLFFLIMFLFTFNYSIKADEAPGAGQDFIDDLDNIKNPFEEGFPKPIVVIKKQPPVYSPRPIMHKVNFKPIKVAEPVIVLPALQLQGVMVGQGMHQAIINDTIVYLHGTIAGARIVSVSKKGVGLIYKGKKFFLKVE